MIHLTCVDYAVVTVMASKRIEGARGLMKVVKGRQKRDGSTNEDGERDRY